MRSTALFCALCIIVCVSSECSPPCRNLGSCLSRKETNSTGETEIFYCVCSYYYDGPSCETPWRDEARFMVYVNIYTAFTVIINFFVVAWVVYEGWRGGRKLWAQYSIVNYSITLVAAGAFIRVVTWCVDAHTIRGIMPGPAYQILLAISQICWFSAGFGLAVYWMELVKTSRVKIGVFVKRYRLFFRVLVALVWVLLIPTAVCLSVYPDSFAAVAAYNASCVFLFITFVAITVLFGTRLARQIENTPKLENLRTFLRRIVRHMISIVVIFVLVIINVGLFLFKAEDKWYYITLHFFLRAEEFALCLSVLYIFSRKKPSHERTMSTSTGSSESNIPMRVVVPISMSASGSRENSRSNEPPPFQ